jgi:hypothetical protein
VAGYIRSTHLLDAPRLVTTPYSGRMPLNPRAHHLPTLHHTLRTHHRALHPPPLHGIVAAEASCAEGVDVLITTSDVEEFKVMMNTR